MGGRPPVVGPLAVVAVMMLASLFAAPPAGAQMLVPLFGDSKPKVVKKRHFRPTLPKRNPMRVTASVSADTVAPPKAENSEVSAVVGTSSSASVTVALAEAKADDSGVTPSASTVSDSSDSTDTETSQHDEPAAPQDVAVASSDADTDSAPAADETASADSAEDSASDTTSGITSDDADDAAAPAAETAEAPPVEEAAPATEAEQAADQVADEPASAPDEAKQTDDAAPAEAELTVDAAADATPSAPAEAAAEPAEDDAAETTAATDTSDKTADEIAPSEPAVKAAAAAADDEAPAETESADASSATDTAQPAAAPSYDASVVLEVSPPPDGPTETKTAALTPPNAPVPDEAAPADDATPAAAEAKPDGDAADANESAETSDDSAEPASAEPAVAQPAEVAPPPAHPIVAAIRVRLAESDFRKGIRAADLKALDEFYGTREGPPLWVTDAGFTDKAQAVIKEIGKADDWGLDASAFDLPPASDLLATQNAIVDDELQLSLAVMKYARYAQVGRLTPKQASPLFDQHPHQRSPKTVLTEIAAASAPDTYLTSLQPQQEQFKRLRQALLKARAAAKARGTKPSNDRDVQLIVMNMERWRWLPRSLGALYVWNNVPEYNTRVIKNGKIIYVEKTVVGQQKYATPLFSAPMRNIVFHPNWTVPPTIVNEDLAPKLQGSGGGFFSTSKNAILARYGLKVSLKGEPIDADAVDWSNVNISRYTFTQDPGPSNVLGKLKFNFPNRHAIYMHDTVQPELFDERVRSLSHGCIRVHDPDRFAAELLAQDKGWSMAQVKNQLAKSQTSVISLNRRIPVHITYFTAVVDEYGNVNKLGDIYGIDNRMAAKMFTNPARFPVPAVPADLEASNRDRNRSSGGGLDSIISGLFGN